MKRFAIFCVCCFVFQNCFSQNAVSLRYFGLTIHPFGDQTAQLQPYKLDKHAIVVANFGAFLSIDHYIKQDYVAITLMQAAFTDCSGGFGGFSHVGIRVRLIDKGKHRLVAGGGPMIYYRQDWNRFAEYHDSGTFHHYHSRTFGNLQYKIFWTGFEFAYHYEFSDHFDFNAGFTPGFPLACSFSAGLTWWPKRFTEKGKVVKVVLFHRKKK
ncbi:hypothetical protein BH09BAC5_BH09BAC5_27910 [soil metagenome]